MPTEVTGELLAGIAAVILSLLMSYVPPLSAWWETLVPDYKRLVMLGLLLLASIGIFALSCANIDFGVMVACSRDGALGLLRIFVIAVIANQSAYAITPYANRLSRKNRNNRA